MSEIFLNEKHKKTLVLASQSPRRQELLALLGLEFETISSDLVEIFDPSQAPAEVATALAVLKANKVKESLLANLSQAEMLEQTERLVILAADTVVFLDPIFLGKPSSPNEAAHMLSRLSGATHEVYTGVAVLSFAEGKLTPVCQQAAAKTTVSMRKLASEEIEDYIKTGESLDKAGAYALQGTAAAFIERVNGCVSNVIGLPMPITVQLLRNAGVKILGL